ncbi:hypothetical protein SAMN06265795_107104 [Noviherbaspirillum humi]|uniref:Uncharacterized protein n=1 Tax=Noviherbaspirillum humi TaxID=1688639 RepID=A0A239HPQ6_9BURK|nr:hypothetical protein [Noviherbaspirillum humi]SNS83329.1 hypothetical protein SAMN06265795_107104 [Noviherbaspirillum humi]
MEQATHLDHGPSRRTYLMLAFFKLVAAAYIAGFAALAMAAMRYFKLPWIYCLPATAALLLLKFRWNHSIPLLLIRLPFPRRR